MSGVSFGITLMVGIAARIASDEVQRRQLIHTAATWLGLFIAFLGSWLYKRYKTKPNDELSSELPQWFSRRGLIKVAIINVMIYGGIGVLWGLLQYNGASTEAVAIGFAVVGGVVLLACMMILLIVKLVNRGSG